MNPSRRPRSRMAASSPRLVVVFPRFCPVAARKTRRAVIGSPRSGAGLRSPLHELDAFPQPANELGVDHVRLEMLAEPLEHVRRDGEQDVRVGDEELWLVVVADEREATLERQSRLGV